ncbi:MAG: LysR family transcriptional regulator [Faecalibacterium sp.]
MELKQLEYFTIVCEKGSFSQAAECLYTSQPNVSKVISSLEKELGRKLVERSSRGLRITPYGETVRDYAKVILKHVSLISSMATHHNGKKFTLATYPSNMITNLLVDFYRHWGREYIVEHQEGSVEEVSNWVASGQTEIGIIGIATAMKPALLIADEPTTAIDAITQYEILNELLHIKENHNTAMIFISHDLNAISRVADRIVVLNHGAVVDRGDFRHILHHAQDPYTKLLVEKRADVMRRYTAVLNGKKEAAYA